MRLHELRFVLLLLTIVTARAWAQAPVQYVYDELGRLIAVVDPSGDTAVYHYDAVGNVLSIDRHASSLVSIIAFSPATGPVGTLVTIHGTGFSATAAQNTVTFNGTAAAIASASPTKLVVTVPAGASTGNVGVTAPGGSATSGTAYTVAPLNVPTVTSFTPSIGVAGASVAVTGTHFDPVAANDRARVNNTATSVTSPTSTSLTIAIPGLTGSGPISVSTPFGTGVSSSDFYIPPSPFVAADVQFTARVAMGGTQLVTISTATRIGLVTFAATEGQRVSLKGTNGISGQVSGCDVNVSIRRPDSAVLAPATCMEGSGFIDGVTVPTTGTYAIVIDPSGNATGNLTLNLYDATNVTASITPGGAAVTVTTTTPGQNAVVSFAGTAGQRVSLLGTNGMSGQISFSCDVNATILKPDGAALTGSVCMESTGFIDVATLPTTGTYTVLVDPQSTAVGSVTLTLYNVPADATGSITPGGSAVTVSTTTPGQNATLTFSGTAGQRVSLLGTNGG